VVNKSTVQGDCHPAYKPCVPIDSDVDCAGGSGNGPSYVKGPITVINPGDDPYGLDNDGDGVGCERR
jgi:resuscitation-promoting factor RpfB